MPRATCAQAWRRSRAPGRTGSPWNIAFRIRDRFTATDILGPYDILSALPDVEIQLVAKRAGPVSGPGSGLEPIRLLSFHRDPTEGGVSAGIELGYPVLDVKSADARRAAAFYKQLGFENNGPIGPHAVLQGRNRLVFMDWIPRNHINFRGPNIPELARRLTERGLELEEYSEASPVGHAEAPECGAFSVFDPDGAELFFNTNPGERGPWEAERWDWGYTPGAPRVTERCVRRGRRRPPSCAPR